MRKIIMYTIMLLIIIIAPFYVVGQALDQTYIDYYNPLLNGATCNSATFQAAITAIGTAQKTLYLTATDRNKAECVWSLTTSITVPSNIRLFIPFGITATINPGITLLANGCIDADDPQWFSGGGTVTQASACAAQAQQFSAAQESSFTQENCYHSTVVGTTGTITSCTAYIRTGSGAGALHSRLAFLTSTPLVYTEGDGDYFTLLRSNFGVTPGGWTCITSTPYCWMKSSTKPALPANTMFILHVVLAGGSITLSEDISYRIIAGIYLITISTRIGSDGTWDVRPSGRIDIASTIILSNAGCIRASVERVFTNTGTVVYQAGAKCTTVYGEWWGATGDGTTVNQQSFFRATSDALEFSGGTILGAGPTAHYVFGDGVTPGIWNIRFSHITFDGQGALFTSSASGTSRIDATDEATQADSGETAQFIHNVHLRNYRVGSNSTFPANQMRGFRLSGCVDCSAKNIHIMTSRGTAFTTFRCTNCVIEEVSVEHGSIVGSNFCGILVHSFNTTVDKFYCSGGASGTGPCCEAGLQVKGGIGNRILNSTIENMANPTGLNHAFFQRGDDPNSTSMTDPVTEPYPYPTNPNMPPGQTDCKLFNCYSAPDIRRASVNTQWDNLRVFNVGIAKCFGLQETQGDQITNFFGDTCRIGIQLAQSSLTGAVERNMTLTNFHLQNIGQGVVNGDGLYGVFIDGSGLASADGETVAVDSFRNIRISNGLIQNTAGPGLSVKYASDVTVTNVTVLNGATLAMTEKHGMFLVGNNDIKLLGNRVHDTQGTSTLTDGYRVAETNKRPVLSENTTACTNCTFGVFNAIRASPIGRYSMNTPAFCTARTTTATPEVTRCVILTKSGDRFKITTSCAATQGTTNRAYYERTAYVEETASVVTVYPNTGTGDITLESNPAWELDYSTSGSELRPRLTGAAGATIDWYCDVDIIALIP